MLQAGVDKIECSLTGCQADTDSSPHQFGFGQQAMLTEAASTGPYDNIMFACWLTKNRTKLQEGKQVPHFQYEMALVLPIQGLSAW